MRDYSHYPAIAVKEEVSCLEKDLQVLGPLIFFTYHGTAQSVPEAQTSVWVIVTISLVCPSLPWTPCFPLVKVHYSQVSFRQSSCHAVCLLGLYKKQNLSPSSKSQAQPIAQSLEHGKNLLSARA